MKYHILITYIVHILLKIPMTTYMYLTTNSYATLFYSICTTHTTHRSVTPPTLYMDQNLPTQTYTCTIPT